MNFTSHLPKPKATIPTTRLPDCDQTMVLTQLVSVQTLVPDPVGLHVHVHWWVMMKLSTEDAIFFFLMGRRLKQRSIVIFMKRKSCDCGNTTTVPLMSNFTVPHVRVTQPPARTLESLDSFSAQLFCENYCLCPINCIGAKCM